MTILKGLFCYLLCVCACLSALVYACEFSCLWRPEENIRSPRVTGSCELSDMDFGSSTVDRRLFSV